MSVKTVCRERLYLLLFSILACILTGCIQADAQIVLNNDGSGKIIITELITQKGIDQIKQLSANGSIPRIDVASYFKDANKDDTTAELSRISYGISCDSVNTFIPEAGGLGRKSVFGFNDINKVRLFSGSNPDNSYLQAVFSGTELTITANINSAEREKLLKILRTLGSLPDTIRSAFSGMRVTVKLSTPREIKATTASFPDADNRGITFLDIDIGKLIATPVTIDKLMQSGNTVSNETAPGVQNLSSVKLEPKTEVYIRLKD